MINMGIRPLRKGTFLFINASSSFEPKENFTEFSLIKFFENSFGKYSFFYFLDIFQFLIHQLEIFLLCFES